MTLDLTELRRLAEAADPAGFAARINRMSALRSGLARALDELERLKKISCLNFCDAPDELCNRIARARAEGEIVGLRRAAEIAIGAFGSGWAEMHRSAGQTIQANILSEVSAAEARLQSPDWEDLRGCAPDATGELSSEEFVRHMRDNDWRDDPTPTKPSKDQSQ